MLELAEAVHALGEHTAVSVSVPKEHCLDPERVYPVMYV